MSTELALVTGLAKRFGGRTVVADVTLSVREGEILGLVGANGGGKTTTLRMLAGLVRPDAGEGQVLGEPVAKPGPKRRRELGYMGQRLALYADLTVAENLRFYADVHGLARTVWTDAVERYGLDTVVDQRFGTLSGGWARRVQFAATVLHEPRLLLLDEPTAGLDIATRRKIWDWLDAFAAAGRGVVISTHDLQEAERCPEVVLYHEGRAKPQISPSLIAADNQAANLEDAVAKLGA